MIGPQSVYFVKFLPFKALILMFIHYNKSDSNNFKMSSNIIKQQSNFYAVKF